MGVEGIFLEEVGALGGMGQTEPEIMILKYVV